MREAALAFLNAALDTNGWTVIHGIKNKKQYPKYIQPGDFAAALDAALDFSNQQIDAYFATSTFIKEGSREAANVLHVKMFKIDLDVDANDARKYKSQDEAVEAIRAFCKATGFPAPTLVDSGNGVHAYWFITQAMLAAMATQFSAMFKAALQAYGLKTDPTCTADLARVLRVPGTFNYKDPENPKPVRLQTRIRVHDTATMTDAITVLYKEYCKQKTVATSDVVPLFDGIELPDHLKHRQLDQNTRNLLEGKPKKFSLLLRRSLETTDRGCNQIKYAYDNRTKTKKDPDGGYIDETRWRSSLAIAQFCEDAASAIHVISEGHPDYTYSGTVEKANDIPKPHLCSHFEQNWPEQCKGCPHKGKIKTPIKLAEYVPRADAADNLLVDQDKNVDTALTSYEVPDYPWPYFRSPKGGVWRTSGKRAEDGDEDAEKLTDLDVYVVGRLRSKEDGYLAHMRVHHPKDGVVNFMIPSSEFGSEKFRERLHQEGILVYDKQLIMMRNYVTLWFNTLAAQVEAPMIKKQFGWTPDNESFVIGEREIFKDSAKFSPAAPAISGLAGALKPVGSFDKWKKIFNVYSRPGLEAHAFIAMMGFASPLLKFTGMNGVMVNAFSESSGTGKSTALMAALSIWGNPGVLLMNYKDTANARIHRMGVYHNLPICVDELTRMETADVADMLFWGTMGRGRERLKSSANEARANDTTWQAITVVSSNSSFAQKLQAERIGSQGELMRLIEAHVPETNVLSKEEADEIFLPMMDNYGWAGDVYARHCVENLPAILVRIKEVQRLLDRDGEFIGKERFWSATYACVIVSQEIVYELGLFDMEPERMRNYILELTVTMRQRLQYVNRSEGPNNVLGEFLSAHSAHILTVMEKGDQVVELSDHTFTRIEGRWVKTEGSKESVLYISAPTFRKFCTDKNIDVQQYIAEQEKAGTMLLHDPWKTVRLARGTAYPSAPVRVFEFVMNEDDQIKKDQK